MMSWYNEVVFLFAFEQPNGNFLMSLELPLNNMTVAEKVQLLEMVWDHLCRESGDVQSPAWHEEVLQERTRRLKSGEATVSSWSDAKARILSIGQ
jgi:Putative addiction module component